MIVLKNADKSIDTVNVTVTSTSLVPVHPNTNLITYHVWNINNIDFQVSDTILSRLDASAACNMESLGWYQNARLKASVKITSGGISFTADILPLISDKVGTVNVIVCTMCI